MRLVRLLYMVSLLWVLCACSSDDPSSTMGNDKLVPIRLTASSTSVTTRATGSLQDTQIAEGEKVYVWADEVGGESNYIKAWTLTATDTEDSSNNGYYLLSGSAQNYPASQNGLSLYAVHGNFTETLTEGSTPRPAMLTHTVMTDQSSDENYQKSDLLYVFTNAAYALKPIPLLFRHCLARIIIRLVKDPESKRFENETKLNGSTLTINGTICNVVTFTLSDQTFSNPETTTAITVSSSEDLKFYDAENLSTTQYCAILPPQELTGAAITITTGADITASGIIPDLTMASGSAYILNVTLSDPGLIVDTTKFTEQW